SPQLRPTELGVLPAHGALHAHPRDVRRLRELWQQVKDNEAPLATSDIAACIYERLTPASFARCSNLLSRQRSFFKRGAPLTGWVPLSQAASTNARRNFFRVEAKAILEGNKGSWWVGEGAGRVCVVASCAWAQPSADGGWHCHRTASFEAPEHAETL